MPRKKAQKKRPDIVSVFLSPAAKAQLDFVCASRGTSIKILLGQLISWFVDLDRTEQSIVLGQVEHEDVTNLSQLIARRVRKGKKRA